MDELSELEERIKQNSANKRRNAQDSRESNYG